MIHQGDCLEVLKKLEANSVDSLVTDPPAGISFMGKDWDSDKGGREAWIKWMSEVMAECLRVMKPGAHGLVWSLPRTSHWTAMSLEYAGFEVRDCVSHLFGSGFPKSLNVSKAIDNAAGVEREIIGQNPNHRGESQMRNPWEGWGTALKPAVEMWWLVRKKPVIDDSWLKIAQSAEKNLSPSHVELNAVMVKLAQLNVTIKRVVEGIESLVQHGKAENGLDTMDMFASVLKEVDTDLSTVWLWNNTSGANLDVAKMCITLMELRQTIELKISNYCQFQNTLKNTALVPNQELVWLIRKPLSEKTVAANVLKWGTGGINVDGCRIETSQSDAKLMERCNSPNSGRNKKFDSEHSFGRLPNGNLNTTQGRFPANLVLSHSPYCTDEQCDIECAIAMLDKQSGQLKSGHLKPINTHKKNKVFSKYNQANVNEFKQNCGTASRFFYCAKVSPSERNAGLEDKNNHPTVKPQKLMRYFCKLITPPNGIILDPFMGSGSTGLAAKSEGFQFIGIEKEKEYFEIAQKRIG